ncbi:MAG: bifunctional phosphoribosylaminoimidazolecarboxamide formyltransferase/IMP cyclohydrolase [Actinomycetota bacterium]|nr:bifunctional phosphoribosylaminoimidazolecarboxamide formyltransferase/IMP cyclohydrolase [Actinomycetota bacterium]
MRALISVYDKTGLDALASALVELGWEIVSSGGTSRSLRDAGVAHREVSEVTGAPEMLDGRVKTLHPAIHGGILADLSRTGHADDLARQGIEPIDLVVCNLYPFESEPSVEMIDVGGPTMVRAAAKNHARVAVVVDPSDYGEVLDEIRREGAIGEETRRRLARTAFAHTAAYDAAIVSWLDSGGPEHGHADLLPPTLHLTLRRRGSLRYGENPHQHAARYALAGAGPDWLDAAVQHGGREISYLNVFDADAAWRLLHEVSGLGGAAAAAVIVKHANPCGVALGTSASQAYERAFACDPVSAFGGIVALSEPVDLALAEAIVANALADVLVAPRVSEEAVALFAARRKNMRVLSAPAPVAPPVAFRQVGESMLVQEPDAFRESRESWRVVTRRAPDPTQWDDVELAWRVCARTSSNAIVLARDGQVLGVGCGQQNRVDAAGLAAAKAAGRAAGGVAASDAFFPFRDGLDAVVDAGASVVVQPGGSLRDDEVVAAADERGVAMVMTGERHFRH